MSTLDADTLAELDSLIAEVDERLTELDLVGTVGLAAQPLDLAYPPDDAVQQLQASPAARR